LKKLERVVLISGKKLLKEIITCRRDNCLHFSPKGKNGVQNAICAPGVKFVSLNKNLYKFVSWIAVKRIHINGRDFAYFRDSIL